jgi:hypothetical protein
MPNAVEKRVIYDLLQPAAVNIDTQRDGGIVVIRPHLGNPTPLTLRYQMKVS